MNNPMQLLKLIKNPKEFVMNTIKNNNNPVFNNLIQMANNNDIEGIKQFGRNLYKQNNRDFDKELEEFMTNLK